MPEAGHAQPVGAGAPQANGMMAWGIGRRSFL